LPLGCRLRVVLDTTNDRRQHFIDACLLIGANDRNGMRLALLSRMQLNAENLTHRSISAESYGVRRNGVFHPLHVSVFVIRSLFAALFALLIYSVSVTAAATDLPQGQVRAIQSLASIRTAAEKYISDATHSAAAKTIATAGELDSRLQLTACTEALEVATLHNAPISARTTVSVRCQHGADWTVYLPVSIETEIEVLVLRQPAARLARITAADVELQRRKVPGMGSLYVSHVDGLQQRHLKRSVPAGTVVTVDMLKRDLIVKRGQQVMLVSSINGIEVRAPGTALAEGGNADRIRVQNASSLKVIEGVIESSDLVRVGM
jgi:flagella basal body P-ring formation protein FlgA